MNTIAPGLGARSSARVRRAETDDQEAWNAFVSASPEGSFFHGFEWQTVFANALGHRCHYLLAEDGEAISGVMPLVEMKSRLFGHTLSSMPFATYCGAIGAEPAVKARLEAAAVELARELGVGALEMRLRAPSGSDRLTKTLYETFSKPIDPDPDVNMKAIRSKQRNVIRKGIKAGLYSEETPLDMFFDVYAESVRNLGTPVFTPRLFREIRRMFPDTTDVLGVFHEGEPVSVALCYYFRDEVCPYFWGGRHVARRLSANDFLAWEIMNRAAGRGCTTFDFGRSKKESGPHRWKLNLGFEPAPLYYEYELVELAEMPEVNPNNPRYRLFIDMWKRLPLPVARVLGPRLSATLG